MNRTILFLVLLLLIAGIELYSFYGLKSKWDGYSKLFRQILKSLFFGFLGISVISLILFIGFRSYFPTYFSNFLFGFVMINLFTKLSFISFLLFDDIRRLVLWTLRKLKPKEPTVKEDGISRSDFLLKLGLINAAIPAIAYPLGMIFGPYNYKLFNAEVKLPHLPKSFNGLKIVQISDIHAGSFYDKEAVNRGIDLLLAQNPDVIFFTGDLVNNTADEMKNYMDVFSRVSAPLGVYSILGNHDYGDYKSWDSKEDKKNNLSRIKEIHGELGWRLLLDEHVYLEKGEDKIAIIGVENWGKGFHQEGDLAKAYEGVEAPVKLLLSHDPTHWDEQVRKDYKDIDITFSGHTHGAQMGIETHGFKWSPISLRYEKWAGLYEAEEQYLYVNRGYGFLGYPGRVGIMPEITVMTLKA